MPLLCNEMLSSLIELFKTHIKFFFHYLFILYINIVAVKQVIFY